ncbi:T9SS type A sorting domain-containing protein [Halocola ammonii]
MKKQLLTLFCALSSIALSAQCVADHDFGGEEFGVYPDPQQGESFVDGVEGEAYSDVFHLKVPSDAGAVNSAFTGLPVDSVKIDFLEMSDGGSFVAASNFGFSINCNNDNVSPNACTFMGGQQGCATLEGTPNVADTLMINVGLIFYTTVGEMAQAVPLNYDGYSIVIEMSNSVAEARLDQMEVSQNYPNPFGDQTEIRVELQNASTVSVSVMNLIGEKVMTRSLEGRRGVNTVKLTADQLEPGIYMYTVEANGQSTTRRMVVSK